MQKAAMAPVKIYIIVNHSQWPDSPLRSGVHTCQQDQRLVHHHGTRQALQCNGWNLSFLTIVLSLHLNVSSYSLCNANLTWKGGIDISSVNMENKTILISDECCTCVLSSPSSSKFLANLSTSWFLTWYVLIASSLPEMKSPNYCQIYVQAAPLQLRSYRHQGHPEHMHKEHMIQGNGQWYFYYIW